MVVVADLMLVWTGPAVADFPALGDVTGATANGNTLTVSIGADRLVVHEIRCQEPIVRQIGGRKPFSVPGTFSEVQVRGTGCLSSRTEASERT